MSTTGHLKRGISSALAFSFIVTMGVAIQPDVVRAADEQAAIADGLVQMFESMEGLDGLDELGEALPFTEMTPTGLSGLNLPAVLSQLGAAIDTIPDKTAGAIQDELNGLDGTSLAGVTLEVEATVDDDSVEFAALSLTRTTTAQLSYLSGEPEDPATFDLAGGTLDIDVGLSFDGLELQLVDGALEIPDDVPDAELTVGVALQGASIDTRLGVLDVAAAGTVMADLTFPIAWVDPDSSGEITQFELINTAPLDLFDVSVAAGSDIGMDLDLTATLNGLAGVTGTIVLAHDLAAGAPPAPTVMLHELGDFTNMTPQDVLAGIAQLAINLRSLQLVTANPDLPLVDENLAEFGDWSDKITNLFVHNHLALPSNPIDLLIEPEQGADCGNGVDDDGDMVADEGCPGQPSDLEAKGLATIDDIVGALADSLDLGDLGLAYADHAVTFGIDLDGADEFHDTPEIEFNLADELSRAGVTSVETTATASIGVDPDYGVHLTVGLDLSDAQATASLTDRVFIQPSDVAGQPELAFDAPITANIDATARIGMLELTLADDQPGDVTLLGKRLGDDAPMISVQLTDNGGDGRITLTDVFAGMSDLGVTTAGDTVTIDAPGFDIVTTANLAVPQFSLDANAALNGVSLGSGGVRFAWGDVLGADPPALETYGDFNDDFLSFNLDPENPTALFDSILLGIDTALGLVEDISGADVDQEIPLLGTSLTDLLTWVDGVQDAVNALASDPAGTLELLEVAIEVAIAQALDGLDEGQPGAVDTFNLPDVPDPSDFTTGADPETAEFDLEAYRTAVENYVADVTAQLGAASEFVTIGYVQGNSPGAITLNLDVAICSDADQHPGCVFEFPIEKDFNLDLSDIGGDIGGIASADAEGTVALDYHVGASVHLGVELPVVTPDDDDEDLLPQVTGEPRVFLADTSGISASIAGTLDDVEFGASIGPFGVQVGETDAFPESPDQCLPGDDVDNDEDGWVNDGCAALPNPETGAACDAGDVADDDGDGLINDGCAAIDAPESGAECAPGDDTDDDTDGLVNDGCDTVGDPAAEPEGECTGADDDDGDGLINDGCEAKGNPLTAKAGAQFALGNPGPTGDVDRFYLGGASGESIGDFFSGIAPAVTKAPSVDCVGDATPGVADVICAHLPIYAEVADLQQFLGNVDITVEDFAFSTVHVETGDVLTNLQGVAEAFAWQLIGEGIQQFGQAVDDGLSAAAYDVEIPVIGDLLDAGADIGGVFNDKIAQPVGGFVETLGADDSLATVRDDLRDFFWIQLNGAGDPADRFILDRQNPADAPTAEDDVIVTLLCGPAPGEDCFVEDGGSPKYTGLTSLRDVQVQVAIGQAAAATTSPFDWGVPGLRLEGDSTLTGTVSWRVNLGFGVSLDDGFYLLGEIDVGDMVDPAHPDADVLNGADIAVDATLDFGVTGVDFEASPAPALNGDLAFIGAALWNLKDDRADGGADGRRGHEVRLGIGVDLIQGDRVALPQLPSLLDPTKWDVGIGGYIDFYARLATTVDYGQDPWAEGGNTIPRLLADLSLEWQFDGSLQNGLSYGELDASFGEIQLDLGSFVSQFLGPVLEEVQRFTQPVQPIIDTLQAPIPGVSQLAELVGADPITLLDLMEALSGADLTLIRRLLQVVSFANAVPANPNALMIPLGGFDLSGAQLGKAEVPATSKQQLIGNTAPSGADVLGALAGTSDDSKFGNEVAKARGDDGGFSFPAFEEPTELFNLLVGQDVELIEFDAGKLKAEVGWSQTFGPIAIGPIPVSVVVSIGAAVEGRFVIGYDTKGVRQLVKSLATDDGNDLLGSVGTLLAGVYIGDLADDGSDPPEIRLTLEGAVGAAVDLVVIKAGIEAGLRATLDMNLHDGGYLNPVPPENLDGKLRIDEIVTFLANPLCLFDVSGKLEAFIRIFVTLDLFLFSVTYKQTIVNIVLLELKNITEELCQPPAPKPATPSGSTLLLNVGPRSGERDFDEGNSEERVVVRQLTDGVPATVEVSYKGFSDTYDGIDKIVGDGGSEDDVFLIEDGDISGTCQADGTVAPEVPGFLPEAGGVNCIDGNEDIDPAQEGETITHLVNFVVPLHLCGGAGADKIGGGDGADKLIGHGSISGETCDPGGDSDGADTDTISGEGGDDDIWGNDGDDIIDAGSGNDQVYGGDGIDELVGGIGSDELHGGEGNDNLSGGPEPDPCPDNPRDDCGNAASDDEMHGDAGDDAMEGGEGRDTMHGGTGNDTMVGGGGDDTMNGDEDHDNLFGTEGWDTIDGGTGDDDVYGAEGNDTIDGGDGDDDLIGDEGTDTIEGGAGWDVILGDVGLVNRDPDAGSSTFAPSAGKLLVELTKSDVPPAGGDFIGGGADPDMIWGQEGPDQIDGDGGDDVIEGNNGDDAINGNAGADQILGQDGADTIFGDGPSGVVNGPADGIDSIRGGNGDDVISGNAKGDVLRGDSGDDTIFGDADAEVCADDGADSIYAGPGHDLAFGNSGDDDIWGEGGVDRLVGGSNTAGVCDGDDDISGGEQSDVIAGDNATIGADSDAGDDVPNQLDMLVTLLLDGQGAGDHDLDGDNGDDILFGQTGDDAISGGNGHDYVEGNEGGDRIDGDAGNDDLIGGSSANDGAIAVIDTDRIGDGRPDGVDTIDGDDGQAGVDWIAGDNALINRNVPATGRAPVHLFDVELVGGDPIAPGSSDGDILNGGGGNDLIFGQGGADLIHGNGGADYVEGNHDDDSIFGDDGDDDLVGGGSADDGEIWPDRSGNGLADVGEQHISGGGGEDYITGDNALIDRNLDAAAPAPIVLFDVETVTDGPAPGTGGGELWITGDAGPDWIFGQTGADKIFGNEGMDYIEGNNGDDEIHGNEEDDDIVGGGSANDGVIDDDRVGNGLLDVGENVVTGDDGVDWITGDNALVNRNRPAAGRAPIELFDVDTVDAEPGEVSPQSSGGDLLSGGDDDDLIFGQGNGSQAAQSDPADGLDNDGDSDADEDGSHGAGWDGDTIEGGTGDDYIEGNHGSDLIFGDAGTDDIAGGGSADDGRIVADRIGDGLLDGRDTIHGGDGDDVVGGDNIRILADGAGPLWLDNARDVLLFDVNSTDEGLVSGGDYLAGEAGPDVLFGQGNGDQHPDQADPLDGLDNDFDGREHADSTEYDCADEFDNDGLGGIDALDSGCATAIDEDQPWDGDIIRGGDDDDYLEGNHGADWMFGGAGEDDMLGGGSANDGAIVTDRDPEGLDDRSDVMSGGEEDDVMTGDNARINRDDVDGEWRRITNTGLTVADGFGVYDQVVRVTDMFPGDAGADTHGDDHMTGDLGNDEMYGQLGDDFVLGSAGDDALVGDLGQVRANVIGDDPSDPAQEDIATNSPHWDETIHHTGSMWWETELYAFDTTSGGVGGADTLLGYDGRDSAFGGPGDDVIAGDGDGTEEYFDEITGEFTHVIDVDPTTADRDFLFGGDDGDSIWGGRDRDVLMGGYGDDFLDVRPREGGDNGRNGAKFRIIPRDRPAWFTYASPENFQGVDFIYGGWDRDALQADQAANGPDPGDRLADWAGGYNVFYLCPAGYGDHTITRMGSPHSRAFLQALAEASGAFDAAADGESGFRDLAYVFSNQRGQNSHPPHPDHPGHFTCANYSNIVP